MPLNKEAIQFSTLSWKSRKQEAWKYFGLEQEVFLSSISAHWLTKCASQMPDFLTSAAVSFGLQRHLQEQAARMSSERQATAEHPRALHVPCPACVLHPVAFPWPQLAALGVLCMTSFLFSSSLPSLLVFLLSPSFLPLGLGPWLGFIRLSLVCKIGLALAWLHSALFCFRKAFFARSTAAGSCIFGKCFLVVFAQVQFLI